MNILRDCHCHQLEWSIFPLWGGKKDLICSCFTFLGTTRVTFALLLDLVALERVHLVGITVGLTLTSPVTDLKEQKHI